MHTHTFDSAQTELQPGINLIEASAGTGKTFAIAMLVLRFVVEQALAIDKILVVTFTKAATEELKDRVRSRLSDAKKQLDGGGCNDQTIIAWLAGLAIAPELIKQRLNTALLDIDQASIFTIHSFCQRVLREHALESGQLFDAELTDDLASIKQACADDFWRKQIYSRSLWQAAVLTARYATPDDLLASINTTAAHVTVYPEPQDVDGALQALTHLVDIVRDALADYAASIQTAFNDEKFKASYCTEFNIQYPLLNDWLQGYSSQIPDAKSLALFTCAGLQEGLNGNKFKANKIQNAAQRKTDYLDALALNTAPFDELAVAVPQVTLALRRTLLDSLRNDLDKRLQQLNMLSLDNLISRLSEALNSDQGELLASELRTRFACALIDEFQDTDDSQWGIFSTVFSVSSHYLYLIGDPKQAIYKFRGADIYTYLAAQQQAQHQFTLGKNWRSHPALVHAVNALFQRDNPFNMDGLVFHPVEPAKSAADGELHWNPGSPKPILDSNVAIHTDLSGFKNLKGLVAPMVLWQLPPCDSNTGYWKDSAAEQLIVAAVCQEIVSLLNQNYQLHPDNQPIQAQDIAILVKTNRQAKNYQRALRAVNVPAVLNSVESVFSSTEARELHILLQAVANPGDSGHLKQALTLDWFGLDGQSLYTLLNNETALDDWMSRFLNYQQNWQRFGLMAMMQGLLTQEKVREQLAKTTQVERCVTNIHHLTELVHQASVDGHLGINKTLDWLHAALHKTKNAEAQQLRLDSDDEAVQIITMHRSKGLEYPIVFCPCLWQYHDYLNEKSALVTCHAQGKTIIDLGSEHFEQHLEQARAEQHAEDLRLFYVAVTRAKYRCYIAWADVRTKDTPNESAMAWLMEFADKDFSQQQAKLQSFDKQLIAYQLLDTTDDSQARYQKRQTTHSLQAKQRQRSLYSHWQMSSYTALSALSEHDTPELPEDKAREQTELPTPVSLEALPKGAHTGNVVHDLLENHAFIDLALRKDISVARDKACQRYSLKLDRPEILDELLESVVKTPLSDTDPDFCLMNLSAAQCLKEMPFYLTMQEMNVQKINDILQTTPAYQTLSSKTLCGYLTGFIDLICEYQGRYYVLDYKTNTLPDYEEASLTLAMREHNYGLQYWLYTVVLHRYLQNRLPDYDYEQHFGGVRYLFVRGMLPNVHLSGVYQDKPDYQRINALVALFGV